MTIDQTSSIAVAEAPLISPGERRHLLHFVANLWKHHELIRHLMIRDIKAQYKQSILGYVWIVMNPIIQLGVLSFIFTTAFSSTSDGQSTFPVFLAVGLLPWIFFTNAVTNATNSIAIGPNIITSVYFPRELLVVAAVLVRLVDMAAGVVIIAVLMLVSGVTPAWTAVWLPLLFFIHLMFTLGLSLPLAALNLYFRDTRFLVSTALYLWFFVTPIFYSITVVPEKYGLLYDINPNARLIQAYRWALLSGVAPPIESLVIATVLGFGALLVGYYIFKKMEPYFADHI